MKINEFDKEVTQKELDILEMYIDKVFNKVGIDVEFTRHFLDRVNDERNRTQITIKELGQLFAKEYKRWGKPIAQLGPDAEAVMKDISTDINIPFALNWDREKNQLELVAKTVMRKKNFKTPNREFPVESVEEHDDPSSYVKTIRKAGYSIYVSKIAGGEGGLRFEVETPSGKEFEVIERETGHYELFKNGPTMSGKSEVFGSLMDAIRAAETNNESINEDLGSIPPLTDLIVMAVVGQTTVAALKAAYKTGKYALKLKRLADKAGVKLNNAVMGESFSSEMNKASKKAHADAAEKRKKMGPVTSDTLADINAKLGNTKSSKKKTDEAINRDEYAAKLAMQQKDKFLKAALAALDRLVKSDPRGQSVGGYAFDIARAFSGVNARELERTYAETHGKK